MPSSNEKPTTKPSYQKRLKTVKSPISAAAGGGGRRRSKNDHHRKNSSSANNAMFEDFKGALRDELLSIDFNQD